MVIALDVGTSSARAALYDERGRAVEGRFHQIGYRARVTPDGGAELDADTLFDAAGRCLDHVVAGRVPGDIAAVGVATFWHGLLGFDARGHLTTPVFLWGDTRSAGDAEILRSALDEESVRQRTGCHVHSTYWPAKLRWLARAEPAAVARTATWGSFGEYLELRLFGTARTSVSMASGTGLLDQARVDWDDEALAAAGIDRSRLFPLTDRAEPERDLLSAWSVRWPALRGVAWFPAIGDGAASNVGSGCVDERHIALNVGTSAALRIVTTAPPIPPRGLWRYRISRARSVIGGATSEGGNVFAWCRDTLRLPPPDEIERVLSAMSPSDRLTVLPFLAGERSPGWRGAKRAAIVGLGLDSAPLDILHAMLGAVALRLALVYDLLAPCASPEHTIIASGAATEHSRAWLQMIADAIGRPIVRSTEPEATGRGTALLALEALGLLSDPGADPPLGATVVPDAARHARYREALARQQDLDRRL
ncbi:MAG: gluconokinase [Candidatus Rokubacteria bacterium]|nr:gluconokinase [Candidatus Rokubacteria bacterium]